MNFAQTAHMKALSQILGPDYDKAMEIPEIADLCRIPRELLRASDGDATEEVIQAWSNTDKILDYARAGQITPRQVWAIAVIENWTGWDAGYNYLYEQGFDFETLHQKAREMAPQLAAELEARHRKLSA